MSQVPFHGYVAVQRRGVVAIPPALRKRHRLDEPGAQVEITERADGVLELRPTIAVSAAQAWFWTSQHQQAESEADADLVAGRSEHFEGAEDFTAALSADMDG